MKPISDFFRISKRPLYLTIPLLLILIILAIWHIRYRSQTTVTFGPSENKMRKAIEGYTDQFYYGQRDTITFYIRNQAPKGKGILRKITAPYQYRTFDTFAFEKIKQPLHKQQATQGCQWAPFLSLPLKSQYSAGYYNLHLTNQQDTTNITFLIGAEEKKPEIAILAPVSTWVAYNNWGGKSLYQNNLDSHDVYTVSANRPLTSLNYNRRRERQSIHVEANIFNWFNQFYEASLFPDYALEKLPRGLKEAEILVLAYHCEYFTTEMYNNLQQLVKDQGKALISLGGNQIYWKAQWHNNYAQLECHKDLTLFQDWSFGGTWKHNLRSEAGFLGVRYSPAGLHTYAPYQVKKPGHWLFNGTGVKRGAVFGRKGINKYPLSGYEMDKTTYQSPNDVTVVAKGLNPKEGRYKKICANKTDNKGGGTLAIRALSENHAILATGSIQSGSGLGVDSVFTKVIQNFVTRYK